MFEIKEYTVSKENSKTFPLGYNFIKYNHLSVPKSEEYYIIKVKRYNSEMGPYRSTKPISKIFDFTPIQKELKNE